MKEISFIENGIEYKILASKEARRFTADRIARAVAPYVQGWISTAPGIHWIFCSDGALLVLLADLETKTSLSIQYLDAIDTTNLNLSMDPKVVPARIGDVSFTATGNPNWDPLFLLCIFDFLIRKPPEEWAGKHLFWECFTVLVEVSGELITVIDRVGPPIYFEEEIDL